MTGGNKPKNMVKSYSNTPNNLWKEHHQHRSNALIHSTVPEAFVDMHLQRKTTTTSVTYKAEAQQEPKLGLLPFAPLTPCMASKSAIQ